MSPSEAENSSIKQTFGPIRSASGSGLGIVSRDISTMAISRLSRSMSIGETKQFSVTVSGIPASSYAYGAYAPGEYELKVSAISGVVQAADLSYVFVLPSTVFSSGMDVPSNRIIGYSVRETLMKQDTQVVPVELEVWAW